MGSRLNIVKSKARFQTTKYPVANFKVGDLCLIVGDPFYKNALLEVKSRGDHGVTFRNTLLPLDDGMDVVIYHYPNIEGHILLNRGELQKQ